MRAARLARDSASAARAHLGETSSAAGCRTFTCMPREPLVLGQPRRPISSRNDFTSRATRADVRPTDAGAWIEIDAQLVGVLEIAGAHGVRMQLDAAQVDDPGEPGRVVDDYLFGCAARGEGQRDGSQPVWTLGGCALLIERLALGAVDEALEDDRAVSDSGESAGRDRRGSSGPGRVSRAWCARVK